MSERPTDNPLHTKPEAFVYRGITVEPETCRLETQHDGQIVPTYAWRAPGDGWVLFAPTADAIKSLIDRRMDEGAAAAGWAQVLHPRQDG